MTNKSTEPPGVSRDTPERTESRERKDEFHTLSGLPVERLYTPEDVARTDPESDIGYPGDLDAANHFHSR